ncbi:hypothetical protein GY45DRAFT_934049 [Cubamyces sp. BRFM 1775]|nr:hypothetical protein GY45DRAFT_934049 [Cubamyces sp. BRFM 1775]
MSLGRIHRAPVYIVSHLTKPTPYAVRRLSCCRHRRPPPVIVAIPHSVYPQPTRESPPCPSPDSRSDHAPRSSPIQPSPYPTPPTPRRTRDVCMQPQPNLRPRSLVTGPQRAPRLGGGCCYCCCANLQSTVYCLLWYNRDVVVSIALGPPVLAPLGTTLRLEPSTHAMYACRLRFLRLLASPSTVLGLLVLRYYYHPPTTHYRNLRLPRTGLAMPLHAPDLGSPPPPCSSPSSWLPRCLYYYWYAAAMLCCCVYACTFVYAPALVSRISSGV